MQFTCVCLFQPCGHLNDLIYPMSVQSMSVEKENLEMFLYRQGVCFSHVAISTVSLGVLKASHKTMFKPPLPEQKVNRCLHDNKNADQETSPQMTQKVEAIEKLGFGVMDKIFLAFDKVFWDQVRYCGIFWDQVRCSRVRFPTHTMHYVVSWEI